MDYTKILNTLAQSNQYERIRAILSNKYAMSSFWLVDSEGRFFFKEEKDRLYCKMIKGVPLGQKECENTFVSALAQAKRSPSAPMVFACKGELLGFYCPLIANSKVIGVTGGCQMRDARVDISRYEAISKMFGIESNTFISAISRSPEVQLGLLEIDIEMIALLLQSLINTAANTEILHKNEEELVGLTQFYKLFEESRTLMLTLEPAKLYSLIANLTAKTLNAETCSLLVIDNETGDIIIKAAVGLEHSLIGKIVGKLGKASIVSHVIDSGNPLLVKDITQDHRFNVYQSSSKYYTKSLISAPLKIGDEIIGVINVNNMATRRPFNETDLKLLSIICGHAAIAIKHSKAVYSKEQQKMSEEIFKDKEAIQKIEEERQSLTKEKNDLQKNLKETETNIKEKEDIIRLKEELLKERAHSLTEDAEMEKLRKELESLSNEKHKLEEERKILIEEVKDKEKLIIAKEHLEKEKEELIKEKEELEAQTEELSILYSISKEIPLMNSIHEVLTWMLDKIQPFFHYHAAVFLYLDGERLVSEIKQVCYINETCLNNLKQMVESKWCEIAPSKAGKKPVYSIEKGQEKEDVYWVGIEQFQSSLKVPLSYKGEPLGLLSINSFNEDAFSPLQRRLLNIISNQVSVTLEKLRLFAQVKEMAEKDELTGTFNYRYLEDFLSKEFAYALQYKKFLSLIVLDFDRLKYVNDTYGHQEGNRLIVTISNIIKETVGSQGLVARFGGDEFGIVLTEVNVDEGFTLAEKIRINITQAKFELGGKVFPLSSSFGVAAYPQTGIETEKDLFAKADKSLYAAKQQGRNRTVMYTP